MQTQIVVTAGIGVRELSCNKTNLTASILILVYVIAIKDERTETKKKWVQPHRRKVSTGL